MTRDRRTDGYALLATLVIVALAGMIAALCLAAITARQEVSGADRRASAATAALNEGLADVCDQLRWAPQMRSGTGHSPPGAPGAWAATWRSAEPGASSTPRLTLDLTSMVPGARDSLQAIVELRPERSSQGLVVSGDVELRAPISVSGGGVYAGGSLRGREWMRFTNSDTADSSAPVRDEVHPDIWPTAGVHALGSIWAAGREIHAPRTPGESPEWTEDTDTHTLEEGLADLTRPFNADLLCALGEHSVPAGIALNGDVLDLARLPSRPPASGDLEGIVVLVQPEGDAHVQIVGKRSPEDCPLVLIVDGDACCGSPDSPPIFAQGALVILGTLDVRGPTRYVGHVHAERLTIAAPTHLQVPRDWRERPLPGLTEPVIVALSGS